MHTLTTLSEKAAYSATHFQVREVQFERKGKRLKKKIIERKPFALVLPLTPQNEIYLIAQYREAVGKTCLEAIAGFMDPFEKAQEVAQRELKEEAGLEAKKWKKIATFNLANNMRSKGHIFIAQDLIQREPQYDFDEDITLIKLSLDDAIHKIVSGEIEDATCIAAILLLEKLQKEKKKE
jgi:ADP-ribose pyrophosphatase